MKTLAIALVAVGLSPAPATAQTAAEVGQRLRGDWLACVRYNHSIALTANGTGTAEDSMRACDTEEQVYLAAMAASFSEPGPINRLRFQHFKEKMALKTELNNEVFKEITKRLNKPR